MVVSLLLMLGVMGLWAHSYWRWDGLQLQRGNCHQYTEFGMGSDRGQTVIGFSMRSNNDPSSEPAHYLSRFTSSKPNFLSDPLHPIRQCQIKFQRFGMHWVAHRGQPCLIIDYPNERTIRLYTPHWFITLIFALGPAIWLIKWNKRRKLSPNTCPGCGYDLTGNESGACPECGAQLKAEV